MPTNFVFLHGGGQGSWVWDETIAAIRLQDGADFGRALALDVPGCSGKRSADTQTLQVVDIVDALIGDIEAAGMAEIVLVGHSQAGTLLPLIVKARPDLIARTIYVSCLVPIGADTALTWLSSLPHPERSALSRLAEPGAPVNFGDAFCNDMTAGEAGAFLAKLGRDNWPSATYAMSHWDYDHLKVAPSTYICCLRDQALLPEWQETFADRVHAKEIMRIDAGHQAMNSRPQALAELLRIAAQRSTV